MRIAASFSTDGQPRVKLVRDLVPCPKIVKPLVTRFGMNTDCATIDDPSLSKGLNGGALDETPA